MTAELLRGAPIAEAVRDRVRREVADLPRPPRLVALLASDDAGARFYARSQRRACAEVGIEYELRRPDGATTDAALKDCIAGLNSDPAVTALMLMMPLPAGLDAARAQRAIAPEKDAEGVHPANVGGLFYGEFRLAPCTPRAVLTMLREAGIEMAGKETVVVGHSAVVGKPAVVMLLESLRRAPTVTCCHVATRELAAHTRRAEVLIVAVGKAGLVTGEMVREGAVVVDVGINRAEGGAVAGDVEFESVRQRASLITPVPGGVGPVTTAMLLANVAECARRQA